MNHALLLRIADSSPNVLIGDTKEIVVNIEAELVGAVERHEIEAYFQPQIDVATGTIIGVEALARWRHPVEGLIAPNDFIPVAESTGLIHEIGAFMLEEGCRNAARWHRDGLAVHVSVNVSALQLATPDVFDTLHRLMAEYKLPAGTLTIEITESQVISDLAGVAERLERLRAIGLGVSLDDFGTGHSSLSQLRDLPITELKIDKSLIQQNETNGALISVAVALLQERGVRVVAEGVETLEQLELVQRIRADRAQGYLFGKPLPVDELDGVLTGTK
ncbi:EAL domain-containing protein (putative c-di-GMP-specific phosphodiesterase class I) [Okibacterium sp. HSC-33S16]|uniref:EAL domain-containing protein n=1 Tax=Okibacterium sp. HSC-33S16 TaxID=2910965 RepID=UPI00209FB93B|nr:EAL domain-containing protein [Okibacterium sp. HSC-33S16]MCP2032199.1 EAL domain-containing protein (putative c-di-GMP-specific phosphodiesterase class I) [Okibacterium sp. HSC-33S16]